MIAGIQDRLHLCHRQDPRQLLRRPQRDRPPRLGCTLADVVQERFPAPTPPRRRHRGQQLPDVHPVSGLIGVERRQRRQLPVDRRRADLWTYPWQHRHRPGPPIRGESKPSHILPKVFQTYQTPVQTSAGQEHPEVLEVMGVRLDGVRGSFDLAQVGQEPLDRLDRDVVGAQDGPGLHLRSGHRHSLNMHSSSNVIHVMDEPEITTSTTQITAAPTPVKDVEDTN